MKIPQVFTLILCFRYFLGNGIDFDAKIDKNINREQIKPHFF